MKRISHLLLCTIMCLLVSCSKSEDQTALSPEPQVILETTPEVVFDAAFGEAPISFNTTADWTATIPDEALGWCQLSQTSGEAGHNIVWVAVAQNEIFDDRNAKITIHCGTTSATLFIVQKQKDALTATTSRFEVEQSGGIIAVEVKSLIIYVPPLAVNEYKSTEGWKELNIVSD